jgi:hypothetical protein
VVAFVLSLLGLFLGVGLVMWYAGRRPVGTPLTWGEAVFAGVFVFWMFFWAYGVVPHQWITWADANLKWRADAFGIPLGPLGKHENSLIPIMGNSRNVLIEGGLKFPLLPGSGRIMITKEAIRDIVAATLYIIFLGGQIWIWAWWQNRGKRAEAAAKAQIDATSAFGRPLVRKA